MRNLVGLSGIALAMTGSATFAAPQDRKIHIGGSIEQFFVDADWGKERKTRDRMTRAMIVASSEKWELKASYWYYPAFDWKEVDETTLSFTDGDFRARIGRFLLPVGQTNWDDQWYSGFVFLPIIEYGNYDDQKLLMRTSVGADAEKRFGDHTIRVSATSSDPEVDRLLPSKLDRVSLRWNWSKEGLILGGSGFVDTSSGGDQERMWIADARFTLPLWTFRGEYLDYESDQRKIRGYFIDVYHRPKGWTDVTLVGRFEFRRSETSESVRRTQSWTAGTKIRLPFESALYINYTGGPDKDRIFLGGGWALGLIKTFKF